MTTSTLFDTVSNRLRASALVVVVKEADEVLARQACEMAAGGNKPIRTISAADPDAMTELENHPDGKGTLILLDFLTIYGENPLSIRLVREVALQDHPDERKYARLILIEQPAATIPPALASDVCVVTAPLPSIEELEEELDAFVEQQGIKLEGNGETRYAIASAVAGLARHEASRLFARSVIENKGLDATWLRSEKALKVADKLGGALTFESTEGVTGVGGLGNLKDWLADRRAAFGSAAARAFGLPEPKGILFLGVPGCGKSLTAKATAATWGLPLLRFDVGSVFGSLVGQSEAQTRAAIEAAEACAPCVLWIDEIEKGLAGGGGGGSTDGGTTQRVFGTLLTWLQDKTAPVFVVATANRIKGLPPELLRKGRFDEIFFVGLPTAMERREIARIHLERRDRDPKHAPAIAEATAGFSGAEIEQAIIEGLFSAFGAGRDLTLKDVTNAAKNTNPLSKTMGEEIKVLETWAQGRARPASSDSDSTTTTTTGKRRKRRGPSLS